MKLTANQIYDRLLSVDGIHNFRGQIEFRLGGIEIVVKQKDVVGNIIQEWVLGWLKKNGIENLPSQNSQMPPDFYLDPDNCRANLLEVKAFNREQNPGFDIADFKMYQNEIIEKPYMINVDYLIFGYEMSNDGFVTIRDLWLKKVWEITRPMKGWPINLQVKRNVVHKIRPGVWYSSRSEFPMFQCLEDFLSAIEETVFRDPDTHGLASTWKQRFLSSYERHYGVRLSIPRWSDIEYRYYF